MAERERTAMTEMQKEKLAYILGALYGDGCFADKDGNGRVHFGCTDRDFIDTVVKTIKDLFGIELRIRIDKLSEKNPKWKDFYSFSSRRIYRYLLEFSPKKVNIIPDFIMNGNNKIKASFIKGFFDAEGGIDIHIIKSRNEMQRRIKCSSNNTPLLQEIKKSLNELGIQSEIFYNKGKTYYVCIWNYKSLKRFESIVGFTIERKKESLSRAVNSYKEIQTRWDSKSYESVMNLRENGFGPRKIKTILSGQGIEISQPTIESWIYGRNKPLKTGGD